MTDLARRGRRPHPAAPRASALAAGLIAALPLCTAAQPAASQQQPAGGSATAATPSRSAAVPASFADLVGRVAPAVVGVTVTGRIEAAQVAELPPELRGTPLEEFFRRFGGGQGQPQPGQPRAMGQGSGFIIDPQGFVVTNHHVVGRAERVTVELADGRELQARVVGTDPQTDIALLRVRADAPLPHVGFGDSDQLRVGEWVLAMGNPFGLGGTATAGIVSARGRQIGAGPYDDFIQTDAPINPGNSGGPLFGTSGEVVGVNTAIFSPSGGNIGIGFAVPARLAARIVQDLRDDGKVERGWLGVSMQRLDAELATALQVPRPRGAVVAAVEPDSPAARGGLRPGDVVLELDGRQIETPRDLAGAVADAKPGSTVTLALSRDGQRTERRVRLGEPPGTRVASRDRGSGDPRQPALGLALAPRAQGGGVVVARVEPGSVAEERGLRPGDVILRAGGREVSAPRDVAEAVNAAREAGRPSVALQIERGEGRAFVALPLRSG